MTNVPAIPTKAIQGGWPAYHGGNRGASRHKITGQSPQGDSMSLVASTDDGLSIHDRAEAALHADAKARGIEFGALDKPRLALYDAKIAIEGGMAALIALSNNADAVLAWKALDTARDAIQGAYDALKAPKAD